MVSQDHLPVAFAVKTFNRPQCLQALLISIRKFYPTRSIVVADDSNDEIKRINQELCWQSGALYWELPFDTGLSAGRNYMVDRIITPYTMILDDDFVFTEYTDVGFLIEELEDQEYDIVGGKLINPENGAEQRYDGWMDTIDGKLIMTRSDLAKETIPVNMVLNFFVSRTQILRDVRWDDVLKVYEHEDFFWRCKKAGVSVGYCPSVMADHCRVFSPEYQEFRNNRVQDYRKYVMAKHGWTEMIWKYI